MGWGLETDVQGGNTMTQGAITRALENWHHKGEPAFARLMDVVYEELYRIAKRQCRGEREGHDLQSGDLLHEAILGIGHLASIPWQDRGHFYAIVTRVMRRILLDHARKLSRLKRGGDFQQVEFEEIDRWASASAAAEYEALDAALEILNAQDPRKAQIVELRFFAGLSMREIGKALGISIATVSREWRLARAWLYREMSRE